MTIIKSMGYKSCEDAGIIFGFLSFSIGGIEYRFTQAERPDECFEAK